MPSAKVHPQIKRAMQDNSRSKLVTTQVEFAEEPHTVQITDSAYHVVITVELFSVCAA